MSSPKNSPRVLSIKHTVNPLYTDTRYNDKIRYNENLNVTKPSLKKRRLMRNYAKKSSSNIYFGYLLESPQRGDSNKYPKYMFYEEIRTKQGLSIHIILSIKDSLRQQIHYSGNIFGNKCCRCNEGSLYYNMFVYKRYRTSDTVLLNNDDFS